MEKVTIKAYAVQHKLSIFNVMKMVKSGKLKSEVLEEAGKELTYILLDDEIETQVKAGIVPFDKKEEFEMKKIVKELQKEVSQLQLEIEALKKRL